MSADSEIREAALKRFMEEKEQEKLAALKKKEEEERAQTEKERQIREEMILLRQKEEEIRLRAERAVLEEEAHQLALKKEEAFQKELERLRNRSELEVVQDELGEARDELALLKKRVAGFEAEIASFQKKEVVQLTDEKLITAWKSLLDWNQKVKDVECARNSWTSLERGIINNPYFAGRIDGTLDELCQTEEVEKALLNATEEQKALENKFMLHKSLWENARDDYAKKKREYDEMNREWKMIEAYVYLDPPMIQVGFGTLRVDDAAINQVEQTFQQFKNGRANDMNYRKFVSMTRGEYNKYHSNIKNTLPAKRSEMDATQSLEAGLKKTYDSELANWNSSKEKSDIMAKNSQLTQLRNHVHSAKIHFGNLNKQEEELANLEETILNLFGIEDIPGAFKRAIQIMRKKRC